MKETQKRLENEKLEEYFFRMLVEKEVNFIDISQMYVLSLEKQDREQRDDIAEANVLIYALHNKVWLGSKSSLRERIIKFLHKHMVFKMYKKIT